MNLYYRTKQCLLDPKPWLAWAAREPLTDPDPIKEKANVELLVQSPTEQGAIEELARQARDRYPGCILMRVKT